MQPQSCDNLPFGSAFRHDLFFLHQTWVRKLLEEMGAREQRNSSRKIPITVPLFPVPQSLQSSLSVKTELIMTAFIHRIEPGR